MKCRHCRAKAISCNFYGNEMNEPYLYQCTKSDCGTFFWHRSVLKEFNNKEKPDSDTQQGNRKRSLLRNLKFQKAMGEVLTL